MQKGLPMNRLTPKRILAVAAALVVVVVGAGGAIAASNGSSTSGNGFLARVAQHLGISTQKLQDATKAAALDQVDADLKAGRLTKAQADILKTRINSGEFPLFGGPRGFGPGFGFHHGPFGNLSAAADYLGLTTRQLMQRLSSGQSLAAVAKAQDKSVDGLKQAMIDAANRQLDQAVKNGLLTADEAKEEKAELKGRIDNLVNGDFPGLGQRREFRFRGGPPRDGGFWMGPAA